MSATTCPRCAAFLRAPQIDTITDACVEEIDCPSCGTCAEFTACVEDDGAVRWEPLDAQAVRP